MTVTFLAMTMALMMMIAAIVQLHQNASREAMASKRKQNIWTRP